MTSKNKKPASTGFFTRLRDAAAETAANVKSAIFAWSPDRQAFVTNGGHEVAQDVVKGGSEAVIRESMARISRTAQEIRAGGITVTEWHQRTAQAIQDNIGAQVALARGGFDNMRDSDWEHAANLTAKQFKYLDGFRDDLENRKLSDGSDYRESLVVPQRAASYAEAGRAAYENTRLKGAKEDLRHDEGKRVLGDVDHCDDCVEYADQGWMPIDDVPGIGDSQCNVRCHCIIVTRSSSAGGD